MYRKEDNSKASFISIMFVELSEIPFCELEELKHKVGSRRYNFPTVFNNYSPRWR